MTAAWNLLVYAIADDPAQNAKITDEIGHMQGALTTSACNVVVQLHNRTTTMRHWLAAGKKPRVEKMANSSASDPDALTNFIDAAQAKQPASATALVLLSHAEGLAAHETASPPGTAVSHAAVHRAPSDPATLPDLFDRIPSNHNLAGVGQHQIGPEVTACTGKWRSHWGPDPRSGKHLRNVDLRRAIARSRQKRVQVLGLNACSMASLEIEYELRKVADIQIASQVYSTPWPYGPIVAALVQDPAPSPSALAAAIVAAVRDDIAGGRRDDTLAAIQSGAALDALIEALDPLARYARKLVDADWQAIAKVVAAEAQRVDDPYQVDLRSFVEVLARHDPRAQAAAAKVLGQLAAMTLATAASESHPGVHGLSIFCPRTGDVDLDDAYRELQFGSRPWAKFLHVYQERLKSQRGR